MTWLFSGWLSLQPWDWASRGSDGAAIDAALSTTPHDLRAFPVPAPEVWSRALTALATAAIKEIDLIEIDGAPHYVCRAASSIIIVDARTLKSREPSDAQRLVARLERAFPATRVSGTTLFSDYDSYYYDRERQLPLPVRRVALTDADRTWLYIDPATDALVARFTRRQRIERWAYHGLHSLDFAFWYRRRPLWDVVVIVLCSGGAALSAIGTILAWRRARRWIAG